MIQLEDGPATRILSRVTAPDQPTMTKATAEAFLRWDFTDAERARMMQLMTLANSGGATSTDEAEIAEFDIMICMMTLLHAKARRTIRDSDIT